jgi:methyl-accepting chemotaxis protein
MRIKTFLIIFASFAVIVCCSAAVIYLQMQSMRGIRLDTLEDDLYVENSSILSWALKNMDPEKIDPKGLPSSWGEIMIVDKDSLVVKSSTVKTHQGMKLSAVPELLDQAAPILAAIGKGSAATVKTKAYMIVLAPYAQGGTLIGLKPRAWEKGIIADQSEKLTHGNRSATFLLVVFVAAGLGLALILSLILVFVLTLPMTRAAKAFEELSLGEFDADLPRTGGKEFVSLSDSFFRLRTSLKYAMERLGRE